MPILLPILYIGQVWKKKDGDAMICVIAVSKDSQEVFVSGLNPNLNPHWSIGFLLEEYEINNNF